ncbi:organic hydroperoxide resistance protein [Sciscionella marina]|uniref:organic hydroperoxide resistance protein n=1 Tax=Sciscionella marina TaxID=508770 RepID=UPI00036D17E0
MKPLYTAEVNATGDGRSGRVSSGDGLVELDLAMPKEMGGTGGAVNPEMLFAAGYSACFHNALRLVAKKAKQDVSDSSVRASVTIGANDSGGFELAVVLEVTAPGIDPAALDELIETADKVCPYSNAIRGQASVRIRSASGVG